VLRQGELTDVIYLAGTAPLSPQESQCGVSAPYSSLTSRVGTQQLPWYLPAPCAKAENELLFCIALVGPLTVFAMAKPEEVVAISRATQIVAFIVLNILGLRFDEPVSVTTDRSVDPRFYSRLDSNIWYASKGDLSSSRNNCLILRLWNR
jgi:hypothetical protein